MYCSTCGVAVAQSLSYCNYCGAKLGGATTDSPGTSAEVKPGLVVTSMVATFVVGLVAIAMLLGMMKAVLHLETGLILGFALLSFLIMLGLEVVFLRLLFRKRSTEAGDSVRLKGPPTNELNAEQVRMLSEPVASVTENTTRAFEPLYNERKSK